MKFFLIFLMLAGCSNLEFVYNNDSKNFLKDSTSFSIEGASADRASTFLVKKIGKSSVSPLYILKLSIVEDIKSEIIDTTSTATKYKVGHSVSYELISVIKNCTVLERKLINSSNFDSKSSGYSFGSDVSKTVTVEKNLQTNIEQFLSYAEKKEGEIGCINEN